ncbi:MAG: hypothetical protein IPK50_13790 [Fibrobacterota bacterium]|nr:MAG: hypothetical protein IPK50_13790 [Fibrobacterota bacterium]
MNRKVTTQKARKSKKAPAKKVISRQIWSDDSRWVVKFGELKRFQGHPGKVDSLFRLIGEKLPFSALPSIKKHIKDQGYTSQGVYIAHDSMGCPRYAGRGNIFQRLSARKKAYPLELEYFSFYVVKEKKHEREIETLLIRAASFSLEFNDKKKRTGISPGNIHDYEAGTNFYERQSVKKTKKR